MDEIELENSLIVLSLETITKLFDLENGADDVALYLFYHKQCKLQKTNQSWTLSTFVKKGLKWGDTRLKRAKDDLKSLDLLEDIVRRDEKGLIIGHYIRLKYIKSQDKANLSTCLQTQGMDEPMPGGQETNALSSLNINAGSSLKRNTMPWDKKMYGDFVSLTTNEYDKLINDFTEEIVLDKIESMENWIVNRNKGKGYKDYNRAIRDWIKRHIGKQTKIFNNDFEAYCYYKDNNNKIELDKIKKKVGKEVSDVMYADYIINRMNF